MPKKTDVLVTNHFTIFTFTLLTKRAVEWVNEYVSPDRTMHGNTLCVEHRYARDLADGMIEHGLKVA